MQTISEVINLAKRRYGVSATLPQKQDLEDRDWQNAKDEFLKEISSKTYTQVMSDWINLHHMNGTYRDENYELRVPSDKSSKTVTDLKYWCVLKDGGNQTQIESPHGFGKKKLNASLFVISKGEEIKCAEATLYDWTGKNCFTYFFIEPQEEKKQDAKKYSRN